MFGLPAELIIVDGGGGGGGRAKILSSNPRPIDEINIPPHFQVNVFCLLVSYSLIIFNPDYTYYAKVSTRSFMSCCSVDDVCSLGSCRGFIKLNLGGGLKYKK